LLKGADQVHRLAELLPEGPIQLSPDESRIVPFDGLVDDRIGNQDFDQPETQRRKRNAQDDTGYKFDIPFPVEEPGDNDIANGIKIEDMNRQKKGNNA
jgi:hypothetical protein